MADVYSILEANQRLENAMSSRQTRLMNIIAGYETSLAEEPAKRALENEIEDLKNALEKIRAQRHCDFCGMPADVPEAFRIRITESSEQLPS